MRDRAPARCRKALEPGTETPTGRVRCPAPRKLSGIGAAKARKLVEQGERVEDVAVLYNVRRTLKVLDLCGTVALRRAMREALERNTGPITGLGGEWRGIPSRVFRYNGAIVRAQASLANTHIVIPTFNESGNIVRLVEEIVRATGRPEVHIWVMDDNSPDGTAQAVHRLGERYPNVRVVVRRTGRGYGNAVLEGMRTALKAGAQWVLTMDADFAHSPDVIGKMLEVTSDADLVIGSRYLETGRPAIRDWPFWRLCMSRFGNWYFRLMLRVGARDNTSGFRCWRGELLERILQEDIHASGYAFITESLFYAGCFGARVREVTNLHLGRTRGESKLSPAILLESLWTALRLRAIKARPPGKPRESAPPAANPGHRPVL